jgi:hypothetical protein
MRTASTWVAVGIGIAAVAAVAITIGIFWNELGASEISPIGWLALGFGVALTLALCFGLMALMFISSRRGFDDRAHHDSDWRP